MRGLKLVDIYQIDKQIMFSVELAPGIANRTFGNRTQSNSIELNPWIEFD